MSNLKSLVWFDGGDTYGGDDLHAESPLHYYVVEKDTLDMFTVRYAPNRGAAKYATGFATIDEAKAWCWNHYNEKMQPYLKQDSTQRIENWFRAAKPEPTLEDLSVQVGCCLEEVCELLEGLGLKDYDVHEQLNIDADHFKGKSKWAIKKLEKLTHQQRVAITDACCDINVTTIGVLTLLGGIDIMGATNEVIRSNDSKFENGKPIFNEQGKIMKGKDYSEPDLTPFIK